VSAAGGRLCPAASGADKQGRSSRHCGASWWPSVAYCGSRVRARVLHRLRTIRARHSGGVASRRVRVRTRLNVIAPPAGVRGVARACVRCGDPQAKAGGEWGPVGRARESSAPIAPIPSSGAARFGGVLSSGFVRCGESVICMRAVGCVCGVSGSFDAPTSSRGRRGFALSRSVVCVAVREMYTPAMCAAAVD